MKQEFDKIDKLFATNEFFFDQGLQYDAIKMINHCEQLLNLTNAFLDKYENNFLVSTHWRIIKMKKLAGFSFRRFKGLIDYGISISMFDNEMKRKVLPETILERNLSNIVSLMKSQHMIWIFNLKYSYFDSIICNNIQHIDIFVSQWENDTNKQCLLKQTKEKLSNMANTDGTAVKCLIDSLKVLAVDVNIKGMIKFACQAKGCQRKFVR